MAVPAAITGMGAGAVNVATLPRLFNNPQGAGGGRAQITRTFHLYLETGMQSKHDGLMRAYCAANNVAARRQDGTQVVPPANATWQTMLQANGFYATKGGTAATIVQNQMVARWAQPQVPGQQVFTPGVRVDAGIQAQVQADGYQYEVSYWYDGQDIYVLFHCYPSR